MQQAAVVTSKTPEVIVDEVAGDLLIKGWDRSEVSGRNDDDEGTLSITGSDDLVHVRSDGDCVLRLPEASTLTIHTVHGNARLKIVEDAIHITTIHGNLEVKDVGAVSVEAVHGNLIAKRIGGGLSAGEINGNLMARSIEGDLSLGEVNGNFDARGVIGNVSASVNGNARLRLSELNGDTYRLSADGNLHCQLPEDVSARIELSSGGESIRLKVPGQSAVINQPAHSLTLGGGAARLELAAGGSLFLLCQSTEWNEVDEDDEAIDESVEKYSEEIARQVEAQVEAQMESISQQLNEQLSRLTTGLGRVGLSAEEAERIAERARQRSEAAAARAQEKLKRAQERLEQKVAAARERAEARARQNENARPEDRRRRGWGFQWSFPAAPQPPTPPRPPKAPASDEERLLILKMLEEKKITLQEAETLLSALEGEG
jgi:hypothetical protein